MSNCYVVPHTDHHVLTHNQISCLLALRSYCPQDQNENMEEFPRLFQNYIYETIDVGRGTDRWICPDISSPQITVRDVRTRVPRQRWPLPVPHRCPNPFCGAWVSSIDMETHRGRFHSVDDQEPHVKADRALGGAGEVVSRAEELDETHMRFADT
jgi:hypothetical protein